MTMDLAPTIEALRQREVQAIGAGLSRRDWNATETAYNELRDKLDCALAAERAACADRPAAEVRDIAKRVATKRQGQSSTPRCEAPGTADVEIAEFWTRLVLDVLSDIAPATRTTSPDAGEVRERIAEAIYNLNPLFDQEVDVDGRHTSVPYQVSWPDICDSYPATHEAVHEHADVILAALDLPARDAAAAERAQEAVPDDIAKHILNIGRVEWGATEPKSDAKHIEDFVSTLKITRSHFKMGESDRQLQGVYLEGKEIVLCHTGTSPNSGEHARILTGLWNELHSRVADLLRPEGAQS